MVVFADVVAPGDHRAEIVPDPGNQNHEQVNGDEGEEGESAEEMDGPRRFYWAAYSQLEEMKKGGSFISFDVQHSRRGKYEVEVVALSDNKPVYNKKFNIHVD